MRLVPQTKAVNIAPHDVITPIAKPAAILLAEFGDEFIDRLLAAIALDRVERIVMPLLAVGQAGIGRLRHEIAEIAGIANGGFDALVGDEPGYDELPDAEIAQDVIDMCRDENAR